MNRNGHFVISLDFELLWGVFDVVDYNDKFRYFRNTREEIPKILTLFERYDIHATWAIAGMLFNKDWNEWEKNKPLKLPIYRNSKLSPYSFINNLSEEEKYKLNDLVFAPELIKDIKKTAGQEIGTHTYSHFYCLEEGQNVVDFKHDLEKAIELAEAKNIAIKTLVFPRNQMKEEYLKVCAGLGINNVRSNPSDWYWENTLSENIFTKLARSGDAYFPLGKKTYNLEPKPSDVVLKQPASRFFRPVESNQVLRKLKLKRIKNEITNAAQNGETYHLWWHPHNFGDDPVASMNDLELILQHFKICKEQYGLQSVNMQELQNSIRE
ncbi:polysaccharide deacetylase family protein [Salinimicrobium terrae]|uniref:polysaccharide deacetylase family protein n=1 Tax=Salinimicrobium terrae TaxID=470866 RepID=UPI00041D8670|nr:polysaccharide deacetylase family protein [Salinimicrobium terrae]